MSEFLRKKSQHIEELEQMVDAFRMSTQEVSQSLEETRSQLELTCKERDALFEQERAKEQELAQLRETVDHICQELDATKDVLQEKTLTMTTVQSHCKDLEKEIYSLKETSCKHEEEHDRLKELYYEKCSELDAMKQNAGESSAETSTILEEKEKNISILGTELRELQALATALQQEKAELKDQLMQSVSAIHSKDEEMKEFKSSMDVVNEQVNSYAKNAETSQITIQRLESDVENMTETLVLREEKLIALVDELDAQNSAVLQAKQEYSVVEMDRNHIREVLDMTRHSLTNAEVQIKELSERCGTLQLQNEEFLEKVATLQQHIEDNERTDNEQIEDYKNKLREAKSTNERLEKRVLDFPSKISSLTENMVEMESQLSVSMQENESLKENVSVLESKMQRMLETLSQKEEEMAGFVKKLDEKEIQAKKYVILMKKLKLQVKQMKEQSEKRALESESSKDDISAAHQLETEKWQMALSEKEGKVTTLQQEVEQLEMALNEKTVNFTALRQQIEQLQMALNEKEVNVTMLQEETEQLQMAHNEKEVNMMTLQQHIEQLQVVLNEKEEILTVLQKQTEMLQMALKEKEGSITTLQQQVELLRGALNEKEESLTVLQQQLKQSEILLDEKEEIISESQQQIQKLELSIGEKDENLPALKEQVEMLQGIVREKEDNNTVLKQQLEMVQIESLENSKLLENANLEFAALLQQKEALEQDLLSLNSNFIAEKSASYEQIESHKKQILTLETSLQERIGATDKANEELSELKSRVQKLEGHLANMEEEQSEQSEKAKTELHRKLQEINSLHDELEKWKAAVSSEKASLEEDLEMYHIRVSELECELQGKQEIDDISDEKISKLKYELREVIEENEHLKSKMGEEGSLEEDLESIKLLLEQVQCEKSSLEEDHNRLISETAELKESNIRQQQIINQLESELSQLRARRDDQEVELETVGNKLQSLSDERDRLLEELDTARSVAEQLGQDHGEMLHDKSNLETQLNQTKEDLDKCRYENNMLRSAKDELTQQVNDLSIEKGEIVSQLERLSSEKARSEMSSSRESTAWQEDVPQAKVEVETLCQTAPDVTTDDDRKSLEEENKRLQEKYESTRSECDKLINRLNVTELKNDKMLTKLRQFKEKNDRLQNAIHELEQQAQSSLLGFNEIREGLEKEKLNLEVEVQQLTAAVSSAKEQITKLSQGLREENQKYRILEAEYQGTAEEMQLEIGRLTQRIAAIDDEKRQLRSDMEKQLELMEGEKKVVCAEHQKLIDLFDSLKSELRDQSDEHEVELQQLTADNNKLKLELRQAQCDTSETCVVLQRKLDDLQQQYDMLSADNESYQYLVQVSKQTITKLERQLRESSATKIQESSQRREDAENQLEVRQEREAEIARLTSEGQVLKSELEDSKSRLGDVLKEKCSLVEEVDRLSWRIQELAELEDELKEAGTKQFEAAIEINCLKKKLDASTRELDQLKEEFSGVSELNNRLLNDNSALAKQVEELHDQIKILSESQLQYEDLERSSSQLVAKVAHAEDESTALGQHLNEARTRNAQLEEEIRSMSAELRSLTGQLAESTETNHHLETKCQSLLLEVESLECEHNRFRLAEREFESPRTTGGAERADQQATTAELEQLRSQLDKMRGYCQELQAQVADLSEERELHMKQLSQVHDAFQLKCNQLSSTSKQYETLLDQYRTLQNDYTLLKESQEAARKIAVHELSSPWNSHPSSPRPASASSGDEPFFLSPGSGVKDNEAEQIKVLNKRLSEVEENCRLVQFENTKLEQTLSTERERRLEAEDALTVVNERLQLQSYMAARGEVHVPLSQGDEERHLISAKPTLTRQVHSSCSRLKRWFSKARDNGSFKQKDVRNHMGRRSVVQIFARKSQSMRKCGMNRGTSQQQRVFESAPIPPNWVGFLMIEQNKEMFHYLTECMRSCDVSGSVLSTHHENVITAGHSLRVGRN
ncbi:hypothetical protein LSH36_1086g00003 [Paralvinella palmiformis]|uniref:Uncharacterized protein n=1 Tax=Paralvinella palmiformis TaxID=53620 RepID=A0AAD9IVT9_9ANNE|nr:hypothetical protein LSH36_1086g00003 [Paralvinella palmiformis]